MDGLRHRLICTPQTPWLSPVVVAGTNQASARLSLFPWPSIVLADKKLAFSPKFPLLAREIVPEGASSSFQICPISVKSRSESAEPKGGKSGSNKWQSMQYWDGEASTLVGQLACRDFNRGQGVDQVYTIAFGALPSPTADNSLSIPPSTTPKCRHPSNGDSLYFSLCLGTRERLLPAIVAL